MNPHVGTRPGLGVLTSVLISPKQQRGLWFNEDLQWPDGETTPSPFSREGVSILASYSRMMLNGPEFTDP